MAKELVEIARIMVLDDNTANTVLVQRILELAGFQHILALNDPEKLESQMDVFNPDVLVLDLHMPVKSGFQVLKDLRETDRWKELPVLVFTADSTNEARHKAFLAGATGLLTKPGDAVEITIRVTSCACKAILQRQLSEGSITPV